jgi:hypothetical protein
MLCMYVCMYVWLSQDKVSFCDIPRNIVLEVQATNVLLQPIINLTDISFLVTK